MNKEDVVSFVKENPYKIAQAVGFEDVREYPHNLWLKEILTGDGDYTLMAHRGSYKSSILSVAIALLMVLYPKVNIIFLRKTADDVTEMLRMVKRALKSKPIDSISFVLYQRHIDFTEDSATAVTTNLYMSASGASQLLGIGIKSSITGKHADIVITDDICNIKDRISRAERSETNLHYQELQNIRNRGGRIINLGTKWHKEDVFSLMENIHVYDFRKTGLVSKAEESALREKMTPALFACNYELKIIADADALFTTPQYTKDVTQIYDSVAHIDAAYGGSDYTAYTVMKKHEDGTITAYGKLYNKHVSECLTDIGALQEKYKAGTIYNENNGDKGFLNRELGTVGLVGKTYHETQNKYLKISSFLKKNWNKIYWLEDTDPEYLNQVLDYTEHAQHDDAPDSAASLLRALEKGGVKLKTFAGGI